MKKEIFFICALFLVLTGFNQQEKIVEQCDTGIHGRASVAGEKLDFTQRLMGCSITEGGIAVFLAKYEPSNDPDIKITWCRNDIPLVTGDRIKIYEDHGTATLVINKVTTDDAGKYKIVIKNLHERVESEARLIVTTKPATR